jgi:hypothetical protein
MRILALCRPPCKIEAMSGRQNLTWGSTNECRGVNDLAETAWHKSYVVTEREQLATNAVRCHPGLDPDQAMQCVFAHNQYQWF